jgi:hypothetical protein
MFQTKFVEKIKTFMSKNFFFFSKIVPLLDNGEKYGTAGQATDDSNNTAHALCMLGN